MVNYVDVTVVGAGPAGSMAALGCARAGLKVVLLEKEKMPRFKACGGGLERNYMEALKRDVNGITGVIERKFDRISLFHKSAKIARLPFGMCCFRRDRFDYFLAEAAEREGAVFLNGDCCAALKETGDSVKVKTGSGRVFCSKVLIGADGYGGVVSRSAGLFTGNHEVAACIDLEARLPDAEKLEPGLFLGYSGNLPGYAWAYPKKDVLSLGIGTASPNLLLNKQFSAFLEENGFSRLKVARKLGAILPLRSLPSVNKGRILLAGDAAGFVDRLGGGIPYALESGRIAARVVAEAVEDEDFSLLGKYHRMCQNAFIARFAFARFRAALLSAFNILWPLFSS